jgi:DNA-directed RNA polymerase specialized sigma24 family protein
MMSGAAQLDRIRYDRDQVANRMDDAELGYELFRRALVERDEQAWAAVYNQYRGLVLSWARQHPAAHPGADDDYVANRAFERLWAAVGPERFAGFTALAAVLQYLKLCVHSVILDEQRAEHVQRGLLVPIDLAEAIAPSPSDVAGDMVDRESGQALLRTMLEEAEGEAEQQVLVLSFVRDLRPREVFALRPDLFATIRDVYRVKRNLIERLRGNPKIRCFAPRPAAAPA